VEQKLAFSNWIGGAKMPSYRVCFINEIARNERLFRCCQRSIVIRSAPTAQQAVEAAKEQFAELEAIRDWRIHAALIEVEPIDIAKEPDTPSKLLTSHMSARFPQPRP
jgi:hypothetical protein